MEKSVFTPHYDAFRARLVRMRKAAGLSQRDLARRVKRPRSFVSRIEQGERRLDVIEFYFLCRACRVRPEKLAAEVMRECSKLDRTKKPF